MGGGKENTASGYYSTVGGGFGNNNSGYAATVGGGQGNTASGYFSIVGGGLQNTASGSFLGRATVGGGWTNTASEDFATIGGGRENTASGSNAAIAGGYSNRASGNFATIPGGQQNTAANYAFAAGTRAKATNDGAFVWADSTDADFGSVTNNQFLIRAAGGVGINTNSAGTNALSVAGSASISGNLNVGSINGRTNVSSYATTFGFVQNNASSGLALPNGNIAVATLVQRPGVAITSCSIVFSQSASFPFSASANFFDVTGLPTSLPATNGVLPGGAQIFNAGATNNTWLVYELSGVNISAPAASPRTVQIVINNGGGGSSQLTLYSITVGFTPN